VDAFDIEPFIDCITMGGGVFCTSGVAPPPTGTFLLHGRPADVLSDGKVLLYVRARFYDPEHGRWLQRDPSGYSDGGNLYESFRSNPERFTDPAGNETKLASRWHNGDEVLYQRILFGWTDEEFSVGRYYHVNGAKVLLASPSLEDYDYLVPLEIVEQWGAGLREDGEYGPLLHKLAQAGHAQAVDRITGQIVDVRLRGFEKIQGAVGGFLGELVEADMARFEGLLAQIDPSRPLWTVLAGEVTSPIFSGADVGRTATGGERIAAALELAAWAAPTLIEARSAIVARRAFRAQAATATIRPPSMAARSASLGQSASVVSRNAYNISTASMTAAEREATINYARRTNAWLAKNGPVTVQPTAGTLRSQASEAARLERLRAARAGQPYAGQAGHVPDTALTGSPVPPAGWLDMPGASNNVIGGGLSSRIGNTIEVITVDGKIP
jgi:RHS repeat-associated protein